MEFLLGCSRRGRSRKFTINEAIIDQLSATGLPVLDNSGKIVKNQFVNNETFGTGYSGGVFFRFVRGSFYLQPEINYTVKAGKFDLLRNRRKFIQKG